MDSLRLFFYIILFCIHKIFPKNIFLTELLSIFYSFLQLSIFYFIQPKKKYFLFLVIKFSDQEDSVIRNSI